MKNRTDTVTVHMVDLAIKMKASKGELAAARFLDKRKVPIEVAPARTLSKARTLSQAELAPRIFLAWPRR